MSNYEIGRDLQELRSRIEKLETSYGLRDAAGGNGHGTAVRRHSPRSKQKPVLWAPEKGARIPPFFNWLFGLPPEASLTEPRSKTFGNFEHDPWIQCVDWDLAGSDEFFRLRNNSMAWGRSPPTR